MTSIPFYKRPYGGERQDIPFAKLATFENSQDLISNDAPDAAFFRGLESQGLLLNRAQIQAVRHTQGPLLTLAGAGSGKTSVLVSRTGYLIAAKKIDPSSILLVTFSSKAAAEMKERIMALPGLRASETAKVTARTFHSFFLYLLRTRGYRQEILSSARHQQFIMKRILREMGLQDSYEAETLLSLWSAHRMSMTGLDELPVKTPAEVEQRQIFARYEAWKQDHGQMDFDDILVMSHRLLSQDPGLLASLQRRYRYVMVDEFQDTGLLPYELLKKMVAPHRNLMVVGDDDQTIYGFNGARNEFILEFDQTFPGAKVVTLDINYRSLSSIVGLGNEIIRVNERRRPKQLRSTRKSSSVPLYLRPGDPDQEAELLLTHITEQVREHGKQYRDHAILYRTANNSRAIFEQLVMREIPFIHYENGDLFYEQWIVKPLMDHLRLSLDRRNFTAMEGMLHTLYMNRDKGMAFIRQQDAPRPKKGPLSHLLSFPGLKDFQVENIRDRTKLIKGIKAMEPLQAIQEMRRQFYDKFLEADERQEITLHKEFIQEGLDELEASAKRFGNIAEFVEFVDRLIIIHKEMAAMKRDEQADAVRLMTIHKSKGLEFPSVCLIGASEGILPHTSALDAERRDDQRPLSDKEDKALDALEEERRLAYVAITRARDELIVSSPGFYRGRKAEVSRFFRDVFVTDEQSKQGNSIQSKGGGSTARSSFTPKRTIRIETPTSASTSAKRSSLPSSAGRATVSAASQRSQPIGTGSSPSSQHQAAPAATEIVDVWLCTSANCKGWQRVNQRIPAGTRDRESKACPLCQSPMKHGRKEVPVHQRR
ncbi:putative ATP-dependent DNA helicase YjcD [Paenibacillus sp. GM2FR]|uniref:UvrD-helicase domain-containing protein n=1 Tax=Paenibacillus sp. GM2FR TaxID=2059268 RepID=UPI000C27DA4A|nr:UvrD-helicase domain-containing protein [Paenibacillus sp. GM2FR]PJN51655.1 putative ATP-dependent DNA helicase YjcD [Paenibacillus sp. GM2FR]